MFIYKHILYNQYKIEIDDDTKYCIIHIMDINTLLIEDMMITNSVIQVSTDSTMSNKCSIEDTNNLIINKGTGAGGSNTTVYGKKFEETTNNTHRLLANGYTKIFLKSLKKHNEYYLSKTFEDKTIVFVLQHGLKGYMKKKYNIE